jgi:hypothetical protein
MLALFVVTYLSGFLLVPWLRMAIPLLPMLCLAVPALFEAAFAAVARAWPQIRLKLRPLHRGGRLRGAAD